MSAPDRRGGRGGFPGRRNTDQGRRRLDRLYVIAAASLAALVPLILFAGFWVRSELNKGQRDVEGYLNGRAAAVSGRIDAEIEQQLVTLRAASVLPALDQPLSDFGETGRRLLASMPHWSSLALVEAGGENRVLSTTKAGWPSAPALRPLSEIGTQQRPRIETEAELGSGGQDVLLFVPVVRDGRTLATLITAFKSDDLANIVSEQNRGSHIGILLVDSANRIIAWTGRDGSQGADAGRRVRTAVSSGQSGILPIASDGGDGVTSAFSRSNLTQWSTIVSMDRGQVERMSTRSVWATIAAGILSLILAAILVVFIVHTVMERRVTDERLSASRTLGELDARLLATTQEALVEQRKSSSEREVLLREIYHRVKNNLQIVQSLLRLGSRDLKAEQREPFEAAVRRVGAMARVHTLLYNSPDLASIDFKDYLEELVRELSEGFGAEDRNIVSELSAQSMRIPLDTAVPLAFIAVEILTNSYRHAFPNGRPGKISIEIGNDEPFGTLRIEDDGIGVATEPGAKRRLGLTIVRKLVQQIGGALEEPPPGSSAFVVRFPLEGVGSSNTPMPLPADT